MAVKYRLCPHAPISSLLFWRKMSGTAVSPMSCSHNPLKELPGHIGALQQLKVLDVSETGLSHLPEEVAALQNLVKLSCQGNAFVTLPEGLGLHQRRLQHVSLSLNMLLRHTCIAPGNMPCSSPLPFRPIRNHP